MSKRKTKQPQAVIKFSCSNPVMKLEALQGHYCFVHTLCQVLIFDSTVAKTIFFKLFTFLNYLKLVKLIADDTLLYKCYYYIFHWC